MDNNKSTLLMTYDYELYLGRSGHVDNCLIAPTKEIVKVMDKHNAKGTFFVDTVYLLLAKEQCPSDYEKVVNQLRWLVSEGHRIELHLHPHWVDANYNVSDAQWYFDNYRYYRVSKCPKEMIADLFRRSYDLLCAIAQKEDSNYKPIAYRAGGWCIEPFDTFKELFIEYGIKVDSSVRAGNKFDDPVQGFDFTSIKDPKPYRFTDSPLKREEDGIFMELPVTPLTLSPMCLICNRIGYKIDKQNRKVWGDGNVSFKSKEGITFKNALKKLTTNKIASLSYDGYCLNPGKSLFKKNDVLVGVAHPKAITPRSIKIFDSSFSYVNCGETIYDFTSGK